MPSEFIRHWKLDPEIIFLNHGSFGACPIVVLEEQSRLRDRMETEPIKFMKRDLGELLFNARTNLAQFLKCPAADLAFVPNATTGVNAVLRSLEFKPGDELLTTNHVYNACRNVLNFIAKKFGASVKVVDIPFSMDSHEQIVQTILDGVTNKTKFALIDHVTSPTALIFPVPQIVKELESRGVQTLIDGAHAAGMLPLNLEQIGASYYAGNCHKWMCAPKGAGFLYVRPGRQSEIRPHVISHGANAELNRHSRFQLEFEWTGTQDFSPYLSVPAAINFLETVVPGGLAELMSMNKNLALNARKILSEAIPQQNMVPEVMLGSMITMELPDKFEKPDPVTEINPLQDRLWKLGVDLIVLNWPELPKRYLRVTSQIYNSLEDYRRLIALIKDVPQILI